MMRDSVLDAEELGLSRGVDSGQKVFN